MRFESWINNATDTHSEYVLFIAFSMKQWLHVRATMLRYTHVACPVNTLRTGDADLRFYITTVQDG